jgi:hypothetical protein
MEGSGMKQLDKDRMAALQAGHQEHLRILDEPMPVIPLLNSEHPEFKQAWDYYNDAILKRQIAAESIKQHRLLIEMLRHIEGKEHASN